eukprot:1127835-Pyramimonas_sp.AAC.1
MDDGTTRPGACCCTSASTGVTSRPCVQRGDQEKQFAPRVDAAMQIATTPVKPGRAAGPPECFGALPAG